MKESNLIYSIILPDNYFINIEDSARYDYRIIMESKTKELTPVEKFVEKNFYSLKIPGAHYEIDKKKKALNNILVNLVVTSSQGKVLAFPRGMSAYKIPSKFYGMEHYSYLMVKIVDALRELEYVDQWNGYYDKETKKGKVSRIWPKHKLILELENETEKSPDKIDLKSGNLNGSAKIIKYFGNRIRKEEFKNPIHLKDNKKNLVKYKLTQENKKMRSFLEKYNFFVKSNAVRIPIYKSNSTYILPDFHSTISDSGTEYLYTSSIPILDRDYDNSLKYYDLDCRLYRVFNNSSFTNGGRFYGADYQMLNDMGRKEILINDHKTIEADYSALHPRMLYHLEKIDYREDPYGAVSKVSWLRKPIKKLTQMLINAKTKRKAVGAFEKYLKEDRPTEDLLLSDGITGRELAKMIIDTHSKVEKYFNSGIGIKLQFIDSQIAEAILKHFMRQEIVCLCIHDSFIVKEKYKEELIEEMKKEYKKRLGFEAGVKVK